MKAGCGHCKSAKPHFADAAAMFAAEPKVAYVAVDCTVHQDVCSTYDVKGFPTLIAFTYGKNPTAYQGARTVRLGFLGVSILVQKQAFIDHMMVELGPDFTGENMPALVI